MIKRAEITVKGLVQGVGFRYFVYKNAIDIGLQGYTKNLYTGEVLTICEGEENLINNLAFMMKKGPSKSRVTDLKILWDNPKNEFDKFEVRY